MKPLTLVQEIARTVGAYKRCAATPGHDWTDKHMDRLNELAALLPSGSGIDCGTKIDTDLSGDEKVVLTFSYHHMDQNGYYDGWTEHTAVVTPSFMGINLRITGRDRNETKDYLYQTYEYVLTQEVTK
jgi:hypothetical protein